ncbi:hypothetical protein [Burkholderia sp. Bp9142]|nr:hypothetical protein [Burkholderia sp. Bp9142]
MQDPDVRVTDVATQHGLGRATI